MSATQASVPHTGVPLRVALAVPLVLLVLFVGALVGFLSFRNGSQAVDRVTCVLRDETGARIEEHLHGFLETPRSINRMNEAAMRLGRLDVHDPDALEHHFWNQASAHDAVSSIYFGNTAGGIADSGREGPGGSLYVIGTDGFSSGTFRKYAADESGDRGQLLVALPDFDARARPWYRNAVAKGGDSWSDIYILFTGQDMALAASRPVYDKQQRLLGVVSIDLFLSQLSDFLGHLRIGKTGVAFIVERSGLLVASSTGERPFAVPEGGGAARRLAASESAVPLVRGAADAIAKHFGSLHSIAAKQQLSGEIDGGKQYLQVLPVGGSDGLDWLVVTVIPEADFMAEIRSGARHTGLLILAAFLVAAMLGVAAAWWLARPILELSASAKALAEGNWPQGRGHGHGIIEICQLELSFSRMAGEIRRMLSELRAEVEERRQAMQALQESEERFDLAVTGAELGTWDWDIETGSVVFNERWAGMLGYSQDEIEPRADSWRELLHPDEVTAVTAALADHLEGRTPAYQIEHRLKAKSGEWRWVLSAGKVLVRDADGKPVRAAGTHLDITLRKQMAEQLMRQERLAAVGQLASGIAHDFNNILTGIMGHAELLCVDPDTPKPILPDLIAIHDCSKRGARLVAQILDFCQKSIRRPEQIDLNVLVRQYVAGVGASFPKEVQVRFRGPAEGCPVEIDTSQIQQVLTNLVSNAKDAMDGGGELRIGLSCAKEDGDLRCALCSQTIVGEWVRLAVSDTGSGICPDLLPRVFEPFFTTKAVGKGTGLGLSQVAGIVDQHGGHIMIESTLGEGTTVLCYFPLLGQDTSGLTSAQAAARASSEALVLSVGGDSGEIRSTASMLESLGYGHLVASDGQEAMELLDRHGPRIVLVLVDAAVFHAGGEAVLQQLSARAPGLSIVLVSNVPLVIKGDESLGLGSVRWVQGPVTFSVLSSELAGITSGLKGRWD